MIAKKITFFLFGAVMASAWWQAAMFAAQVPPLWALAVIPTILCVIIWTFQIADNWNS